MPNPTACYFKNAVSFSELVNGFRVLTDEVIFVDGMMSIDKVM